MGLKGLAVQAVMLCIIVPYTLTMGFLVALSLLWGAVTKGPRALFSREARTVPPAPMLDSALGEHAFVTVNGISLHYVSLAGPTDDAPLCLLLHGFPECWYTWRYQLAPLRDAGYRVVAVDMRGYNLSEKPAGRGAYAIDVLASDVPELVRALGHEKCVLVAHDWGGVVAYHAAHRYPHMVSHLIALNIPHPKTFLRNADLAQLRRSWYIFFFQLPWLPELSVSAFDYAMIGAAFRGRMGVVDRTKVNRDDIECFKFAMAQPGATTATINYYRNVFFPRPSRGMRAALAQPLEMPTLVIWGMRDGALGSYLNNGIEAFVNDVTVVEIEDASHWVQQDAPDRVNQTIIEWLATRQ